MRALPIALLLMCFCSQAWAGVYNPSERPLQELSIGYDQVAGIIYGLRAIAVEPKGQLDPDSPRALNLRYVEHYEPMRKNGTLSTTDAVTLSAAYIRLGKAREAIKVLRAADPSYFLVQANLAGAYQSLGELEAARRHQARALEIWPDISTHYSSSLLDFYRECEKCNLRLMESRLAGGQGLDPIFPGVRFVNDEGKYAAGELSRKSRDKLPNNAINLMLQLVAWQPNDPRLVWMIAELLNAQGQVRPAYALMDNLSDQGFGDAELRRHRKILQAAKPVRDKLDQRANSYLLQAELMLIPLGRLGIPVSGDVAYLYSTLAMPLAIAPFQDQQAQQQPQPPQLPGGADGGSRGFFNVTHVTVSFVFGFLVAALLGLQLQVWRRRRGTVPAQVGEAIAPQPAAPKPEAVTPKQEGLIRQGPP